MHGARRLGVRVERLVRDAPPAKGARTGVSAYTLLIDGEPAGSLQTQLGFHNLISWSGLDIGRDRGSPVSHYDAPFEFTGRLLRVTVAMHDDQSSTATMSGTPRWRGSSYSAACLIGPCSPSARSKSAFADLPRPANAFESLSR